MKFLRHSSSSAIVRNGIIASLLALAALLIFVIQDFPIRMEYVESFATPLLSDAVPEKEEINERLIFVGDSGSIKPKTLQLLARRSAELPEKTTVVLLGDNIYPNGLPDPLDQGHDAAKKILTLQLRTLKRTGASIKVIPGNHDWGHKSTNRLAAVRREQALVEEILGPDSFLPKNGCPGPDCTTEQVITFT